MDKLLFFIFIDLFAVLLPISVLFYFTFPENLKWYFKLG